MVVRASWRWPKTLTCVLGILWCSSCDTASEEPPDGGEQRVVDAIDESFVMCEELEPGYSGGRPFVPAIAEDEIRELDLEVDLGEADVAVLESFAAHYADDGVLRITLAGIFDVDHERPSTPFEWNHLPLRELTRESFEVTVDGAASELRSVTCSGDPSAPPISVTFLIDVTGSMFPAIAAVRDSLVTFVDLANELGIRGEVGVVTFQDTVGVDIPFDDCGDTERSPERSPFFAPVPFTDRDAVAGLRDFIGTLVADRGSDVPENLAGAIDFAANNVIGNDADGLPNVIGVGGDDPPFSEPWPASTDAGLRVLIAITDAPFHGDLEQSPGLPRAFKPRRLLDIVRSLGTTVVGVIDPAILDQEADVLRPQRSHDADLFAAYTGGFGVDHQEIDLTFSGLEGAAISEDISFFDLELLVLGNGLLEIPLAPVLASTCVLELEVDAKPGRASVQISSDAGNTSVAMEVSGL